MSWLLFMDESGHDHKTMPYEVRGGIAIHAGRLWSFVQAWKKLELSAFGAELSHYRKEIKGSKLLDKDRAKWASQGPRMEDDKRRKSCRAFLQRGLEGRPPIRDEFTAYGQACREMSIGAFDLMRSHGATLFASAIPRGVKPPPDYQNDDYLRKDQVFLFERYFYFLETKNDFGLIVMDQTEKTQDQGFIRRMQSYFQKTQTGRYRTARIVPFPLFVESDMAIPVQAADLCIYCVNWGYRLPTMGMIATERLDIKEQFTPWLQALQFHGEGYRDGRTYTTHGIVFVPDPYDSREEEKRR